MQMKFDKAVVLDELKQFVRPVTLISTLAEAKEAASVPVPWQKFIEEDGQGLKSSLLAEWGEFSKDLPSIQEFLQTMLKSLYIMREQDDVLSLLYFYTENGNGLNFYRGRTPVSKVPKHLVSIWDRVPMKLRNFYTKLHDGWTFLPANSMGPLPIEEWAFLSDDKFDLDEETSRSLPFDVSKTVAVFHNGAGDYLCLNCAGNDKVEASGIIWWHEDPSNSELVDFWSVLDAWVGIFLEQADR